MNEFKLFDDENNEITFELVALFHNGDDEYIAYTIKDDDELLVSKYVDENEEITLIPIESEEEWKFVEDYLEKNVYSEEEQDD